MAAWSKVINLDRFDLGQIHAKWIEAAGDQPTPKSSAFATWWQSLPLILPFPQAMIRWPGVARPPYTTLSESALAAGSSPPGQSSSAALINGSESRASKGKYTMLKTNIQEALNNQINGEMASTYLYLAMAAYFESKNLQGLAKWMEVQAGEEWGHAMKIYHHVNECGGRVILKQIDPHSVGCPRKSARR